MKKKIITLLSLTGITLCNARHEPGHVDYGGFEIPTGNNTGNGRMRDRGPGSLERMRTENDNQSKRPVYTTLPVVPKKPVLPPMVSSAK